MHIHRKLTPKKIAPVEPVVEAPSATPEEAYETEEYRITKGTAIAIKGFPFIFTEVRRNKAIIKPAFPYSYANGVMVLTKVVKKKDGNERTE